MRFALGSRLTLLAALGVISTGHPSLAQSVQFDQAEIADPTKLVLIAGPIGSTSAYKLLIFEQLNDRRLCWQELGKSPTIVDPLFMTFDFTGICARGTDSNSYSIRLAGEDFGGRYNLRVVRKNNELVLIGFSLVDKNIQFFEIGRTNGLAEGFIKIELDPGWRLTRRSFQGKAVGHIYLTNDQPLAVVAKKAVPLPQSPPDSSAPPSTTLPVAPQLPAGTAPDLPVPPGANRPDPNLPPPPPTSQTQPATGAQPAPASFPSPSKLTPLPSPSSPVPGNPAPTNGIPSDVVVPSTPLYSPPDAPPASAPKELSLDNRSFQPQKPKSVVIPVASGRTYPAANAGFGTSYRVVVDAMTPAQQEQVKSLEPNAFRMLVNGQRVMQVGIFRDRAIATSLQQSLLQQNLAARILPVAANLPIQATRPATAIAPLPGFSPAAPSPAFNLPALANASLGQDYSLWATYYYTHRAANAIAGAPLLDLTGNSLGITLTERDWCASALEGSVQVINSGQILGVFNYAGRGDTAQVDCSPYYPRLKTLADTNRVRFKLSNTAFGEGVSGYALVPYRTIAVDRSLIPIGSVLYIPAARGTVVVLPSGGRAVHDGYFYAADVGKAITGNHIDVFLGVAERNPFSFVKSTESAPFTAYLVNNSAIKARLTAEHQAGNITARSSGL